MRVIGIGLYGSNESTLNFEILVNQLYSLTLEIIFYIGILIAFSPLFTWKYNR